MTRAIHGFGLAIQKRKTALEQLSIAKQCLLGFLAILLLSTAFSVVYLKDFSRRLFIQYQQLQTAQQQQELSQNKLLLQKGDLSSQSRIQSIALHELNMIMPSMKQVIILRE